MIPLKKDKTSTLIFIEMKLPDLPKKRKTLEADFGVTFRNWFEKNYKQFDSASPCHGAVRRGSLFVVPSVGVASDNQLRKSQSARYADAVGSGRADLQMSGG